VTLARRGFLTGGCALCAATLMACTPTSPDGRPLTGIDGDADLAPRVAPGARTGATSSADDGLRAMFDQMERQLRGSRFLVRDRRVNEYVRGVVREMAGDYADDIRAYTLRVPEFNASQASNGMMNVWTGLLVRCTNEAQMAAVLGHEIGHYTRAHGQERDAQRRQAADIQQFLAFIFAGLGVAQAGDLTNLILTASFFSYSRDHKREADEIGIRMLADRGLAPIEAARNWENVSAEAAARGLPRNGSIINASHPRDEERQASLRARAAELPAGDPRFEAYREGISSIRETIFEDQIRTGAHSATVLIADRWLQNDAKDGLALYAKGEALRQRARDDDEKNAVEALAAALADRHAPASAWRSLGLLKRKLGKEAEARELLNDYLRRAPAAPDREIIRRSIAS
jgi:predicted Zn-dependent protease